MGRPKGHSSSQAVEHATLEEALCNGIELESNACLLCHGWTCAPLLVQFVAHFLKPLRTAACTAEQLAQQTGAAIGPLLLLLRTCRILGYLELDPDSDEYVTVPSTDLDELEKFFDPDSATTKALMSIYVDAVPPFKVPSTQATCCMSIWQAEHWGETKSKALAAMCDGAVLTPLLTSLTYNARYNDEGADVGTKNFAKNLDRMNFRKLDEQTRTVLGNIFETIGVGNMDLKGVVTMTDQGSAALQKCYSYFMPMAYVSALANFHHTLFGDRGCANSCAASSRLLDSQAHQQTLLRNMMSFIGPIFKDVDFSKQPSFLVDIDSSSDAYLLTYTYDFIKRETPRGRALRQYPLTLVCGNSNKSTLATLKGTFDTHGMPSVMICGKIGPEEVTAALAKEKIDNKKCLHMRAFAEDHRSYTEQRQAFSKKSSAALFAQTQMGDLVHLNKHGTPITASGIFASLVHHFEHWAIPLDGSFGLCVVEDMMLDVASTARFFNDSVSFSLDIVRALSQQYAASPVAFALAAAMAGLFPRNFKNVKTYPRRGNYCRTMAQHLVKRPFKIRLAEMSDLPELVKLEALVLEKHLQVPEQVLRKRLKVCPTTVLVVTVEDNLAGVLYMQKIENLHAIDRQKLLYVHETHDPDGSVIQMISMNIHPKYASMAIGSDLRDFALHLAHLDASINSVVTVSRCCDYHSYLGSLNTYVDSHNSGRLVDPILDFHTSCGAKIQRLVNDFCPEDTDNHGAGVLVQYFVNDLMVPAGDDDKTSAMQTETYSTIKELMKEWGYEVNDDDPHRGFFDYGMDSVEIQAVRNKLSHMFGYELPVSMMLDYPSVMSLSNHLDSISSFAEDEMSVYESEGLNSRPVYESEGLDSIPEEEEDSEAVPSTRDPAAPKNMRSAVENGINLGQNTMMLAHGWTCGPLLLEFVACFLKHLRKLPEGATATELARLSGAAVGPLAIVLRTCNILEYVAFDDATSKYSIVDGMELQELAKFLDPSHPAANAIDSIYTESSPPFRMDSAPAESCLGAWEEARHLWKFSRSKALQLLMDGIILTPLLASIAYYGLWSGEGFDYKKLSAIHRRTLSSILEEVGVGTIDSHGKLTMTSSGSEALKHCYTYFIPTSYSPMLSNFNHILYRDSGWGFVQKSKHIKIVPNRNQTLLKVVDSGLPHLSWFNDMMYHVNLVFNGDDFSSQPTHIADTGSDDGYYLMHAYEFVKSRTPRGRVLSRYPLTVIGIRWDEDSESSLTSKLIEKGIPHIDIIGCMRNPASILSQFESNLIDPSKVLHVRAFVNHDHPYMPSTNLFAEESAVAAFARNTLADITHLDNDGMPLTSLELFCSYLERFREWAAVLEGTCGMCIFEEMMLDVATTKEFLNDNVSFHANITQALSRHHRIPPAAFALSAAMAGLLPTSFKAVRAYPEHGAYCRVVNVHLVKRPFQMRLAELSDMPSLLKLEALAWEKHMRASQEILLRRLTTSPTTNIVCTIDGMVVGVLYMQKIPSLDTINREKFMRISEAHDPNGTIIQLIAVNVNPEHKTMGIGSELRAFALYMARLDASISSVCAVTLCRDYCNFKGSMQDYIDKHVEGKLNDPIVGFHTGYGAVVQRLVPNFRPEDTDNRGTGVLIEYQINNMELLQASTVKRTRRPSQSSSQSGEQKVPSIHILKPIFSKCGYEITDDKMDQGFFGDMGFGMDSLDSVYVINQLSSKLCLDLQNTLFFDYPTVRSLCQQLDQVRKVDKPKPPKSGEDRFVKQISAESSHSQQRPRSNSMDSGISKMSGQVRSWDKMSARELLEIQSELCKLFAQPKTQERLCEVARKCYPDFMNYTREIEPILCEVEGSVMLEHGYIEDDSFEIVQQNRKLFFSQVFLKYCHKEPEVRRLGLELVKITGQDQNWDALS